MRTLPETEAVDKTLARIAQLLYDADQDRRGAPLQALDQADRTDRFDCQCRAHLALALGQKARVRDAILGAARQLYARNNAGADIDRATDAFRQHLVADVSFIMSRVLAALEGRDVETLLKVLAKAPERLQQEVW